MAPPLHWYQKIHDLVHDLPSLLIEPIQRIPRYKLMLTVRRQYPTFFLFFLLFSLPVRASHSRVLTTNLSHEQDIIKHTNQEHPDYYNLKEAEQVIEHILAEMNLAAKFSNNRRKILDIEYMFNGDVVRASWRRSVEAFVRLFACLLKSATRCGHNSATQNLLDWADNRRYVQSADIRAITQHLQKERRQLVDVRIWLFSDRIIIGQLKEEYFEGEPEYHLIASMDLFDVHVEVSHERQKDDKTAERTFLTRVHALDLLLIPCVRGCVCVWLSNVSVPPSNLPCEQRLHGHLRPRARAAHVAGAYQQAQDTVARRVAQDEVRAYVHVCTSVSV